MDMGPILGASNNANLYKLWQVSWISRWYCSVWVGNTMTPDRLEDSVMLQGLMNWWDISCIWRSKEDGLMKMYNDHPLPQKWAQFQKNIFIGMSITLKGALFLVWRGAGHKPLFFTKELVCHYPVTTPRPIKVHIDPSARRQASDGSESCRLGTPLNSWTLPIKKQP